MFKWYEYFFIIFLSTTALFLVPNYARNSDLPDVKKYNLKKYPEIGQLEYISGESEDVLDFAAVDYDFNGVNEVCILRRDQNFPYSIVVRNIKSNTYMFSPIQVQIQENTEFFYPIENHPKFKWLTFRVSENEGFIDLYNYRLQHIDSIKTIRGFDHANNGKWHGYYRYIGIIDINGDERLDLLVGINTAVDGQPRALLGYDFRTKENILNLRLAPLLTRSQVVDFGQDGNPEILVTLGGASDGLFFGQFERDKSYLLILNHDGTIKKYWQFGGESSYLKFDVADFNHDQYLDIVVGTLPKVRDNNEPSRLQLISGKTYDIFAEYETVDDTQLFKYLINMDLGGDSDFEILTMNDRHVNIFQYDKQSLKLINRADFGSRFNFLLSQDLNYDGEQELFFYHSGIPCIFITDSQLMPLGKISIDTHSTLLAKLALLETQNGTIRRYGFKIGKKFYVLKISNDEIFPAQPFQFPGLGIKIRPSLVLLLIIIPVVLLIIFLIYFLQAPKTVPLSESSQFGWAILDSAGYVKKYNHTFLRLVHIQPIEFKNSIFLLEKQNSFFPNIVQMYSHFNSNRRSQFYKEINTGPHGNRKIFGTEFIRTRILQKHSPILLLLIDLTETKLTEQAKLWASMAQRVAHKIKTPLGTILLAIQRLQRKYQQKTPDLSEEFDKLTNTAISEIERVRETINVFMKISRLDSPNLQTSELNQVFHETVGEYKRRLPEGVDIEFQCDDLLLNVKIDTKHFKEAIFNIFDNAVTAMGSQGQLKISTIMESNPLNEFGGLNFAVIEITDTGRGMSGEELENIFKPGFTTSKHGSGMGLMITKNIIQNFGGEIDVHSALEIGTTFIIRLPLIE